MKTTVEFEEPDEMGNIANRIYALRQRSIKCKRLKFSFIKFWVVDFFKITGESAEKWKIQ